MTSRYQPVPLTEPTDSSTPWRAKPLSELAPPPPANLDAESELRRRLKELYMEKRLEYTTGEVAHLLGTSRETVRQMILRWEPQDHPGRNPCGLFAHRLLSHRRVPHHALITWLQQNNAYTRDTLT